MEKKNEDLKFFSPSNKILDPDPHQHKKLDPVRIKTFWIRHTACKQDNFYTVQSQLIVAG